MALHEEARRARLLDVEVLLLKAAWFGAAWAAGGLPRWEEVERAARGLPKDPVPADVILARLRPTVGRFMKEAARG